MTTTEKLVIDLYVEDLSPKDRELLRLEAMQRLEWQGLGGGLEPQFTEADIQLEENEIVKQRLKDVCEEIAESRAEAKRERFL